MSTTNQAPAIDMDKLNAFIGRFVGDLGAAVHAGMVVIGEKLGLYKALINGPMTSEIQLDRRASLHARSGRQPRVPVRSFRARTGVISGCSTHRGLVSHWGRDGLA